MNAFIDSSPSGAQAPSPAHQDRAPGDAGFVVVLARSQRRVEIGAGESVAHVLAFEGVQVDTVCEQGICGTCITPFLAGEPEHHDSCLSEAERATHVALCCVRSRTPTLTLDL